MKKRNRISPTENRNIVLELHAEWLFQNGYLKEWKNCLKEAEDYKAGYDWRQSKKKYKYPAKVIDLKQYKINKIMMWE